MTAPFGTVILSAGEKASVKMLQAWTISSLAETIVLCAKHPGEARALLSTAIRETRAEELAEALQESIEGCNGFSHEELMRRVRLGFLDHSAVQRIMKARAILAKFKEIANG